MQIEEQDVRPSSFKNFLDQQKESGRTDGDAGNNRNGSPEWETVIDPKLYIITEYDENAPAGEPTNQNEVRKIHASQAINLIIFFYKLLN